jgi:hypothetical protein
MQAGAHWTGRPHASETDDDREPAESAKMVLVPISDPGWAGCSIPTEDRKFQP